MDIFSFKNALFAFLFVSSHLFVFKIFAMNVFKGMFYAIVGFVLLIACEPVQNSFISDSYLLDIYKINNNTGLTPEFGDTTLFVSNFSEFKLKPGDRACLYLHKHLDAYNSKNNDLKIVELVEIIPTLPLEQRDALNVAEYDLPLRATMYNYNPSIWIWDNRLNVNALFAAKPDATDFAMTVNGIANDTVMVNLLAKTTEASNEYSSKLLAYDLANIGEMLTHEEQEALKSYEKLIFRIYLKNKGKDGQLIEIPYFVEKGAFANPLYN